jgi:hypothetical protein
LERSHSARLTLQKACELLPDEVIRFWTFFFIPYLRGKIQSKLHLQQFHDII